jgi:hypothetical protein
VEDTTNDLFSEIQEELRQERILKFWKAYHKPFLASIAAVVVGIVAYSSWTQSDRSKAEETAAELVAVAHTLDKGDTEQALLRLRNLERTAPKKATYIAAILRCFLSLESTAASEEEKVQALSQLQSLAKNPKIQRIWTDLALLKMVSYALTRPSQVQQVDSLLEELSAEGRPYRIAALELSAVQALQKGEKDRARDIFQKISEDSNAPSMAKERAVLMLQGPTLRP